MLKINRVFAVLNLKSIPHICRPYKSFYDIKPGSNSAHKYSCDKFTDYTNSKDSSQQQLSKQRVRFQLW